MRKNITYYIVFKIILLDLCVNVRKPATYFFCFREQANNPALIAFLAVFIIIALCLLILLIYDKRLKLKTLICSLDEDDKQKGMLSI